MKNFSVVTVHSDDPGFEQKSGVILPLSDAAGGALPSLALLLISDPIPTAVSDVSDVVDDLASVSQMVRPGPIGAVLRERDGIEALSRRERDCVQLVARGDRVDAVAERLGLAPVTISLHLRNARRKLRCRTLPETIARAILYQQITLP